MCIISKTKKITVLYNIVSHFCFVLLIDMFPLSSSEEESDSSRKLHHLLNTVTDGLVWVIAKSGIPFRQQSSRLANLLMLLSHVRHARYNHTVHTNPQCEPCKTHTGRGELTREHYFGRDEQD